MNSYDLLSLKKRFNLKNLEISLSGGEYDLISLKKGKIVKSHSYKHYVYVVRGEERNNNYFLFKTHAFDDIAEILRYNLKSPNTNLIKYPFLKNHDYFDTTSEKINEINNLLLFESVSKLIFKLIESKQIINSDIYFFKNRISPYSNIYPPFKILNSNNLNAFHQQSKIVFNLQSEDININKIFMNLNDLRNFIEDETERYLKLEKLKYKKIFKPVNRLFFSAKSVSKVLQKIRKFFSATQYYENPLNPFKNLHDKRIFSHKVNLYFKVDHKLLPVTPFDEIGFPKRNFKIIDRGYFKNFTVSYHESLKYNLKPTGHSLLSFVYSIPETLYLKGGKVKFEDLDEKEFIYVEDMEISDIKSLNDKFKIVSSGNAYLYKNGRLSNGIENFNLKLSLKEFFTNIIEVGEESENFGIVSSGLFLEL